MAKGKGGKDVFWFTGNDAIKACAAALRPSKFRLSVPPHIFDFSPDERVSDDQWISSDSVFEQGTLIAHITMTIERLQLHRKKQDGCHAFLKLDNLHYTVRKKEDSDWIAKNISKVTQAQAKKKKATEEDNKVIEAYKKIQQRSLHQGLRGEWNTGNKANTETAKQQLGMAQSQEQWPADMAEVARLICTVGASALKGRVFSYDKESWQTGDATITFTENLQEIIRKWESTSKTT